MLQERSIETECTWGGSPEASFCPSDVNRNGAHGEGGLAGLVSESNLNPFYSSNLQFSVRHTNKRTTFSITACLVEEG